MKVRFVVPILSFLIFTIDLKGQIVFSSAPLSFKEYGQHIIDSLKSTKTDSIIAYYRCSGHHWSPLNEEFEIVYLKNKKMYQFTLIKANNSDSIKQIFNENTSVLFMDIVVFHKTKIFSLLDNNKALFNDTISIKNGQVLIRETDYHGVDYFFYIKIGDIERSSDFCCGISLNENFYSRAYPLWLLVSAFNNYFFLDR